MKRSAAIFLIGSVSISAVAVLFSCIDEHARPDSDSGPSAGAVQCDAGGPGEFPPGNCDPSDNSCPPTGGTCTIDQQKCGDPSTCLPLADNSKKTVYDFRLRRLLITAPQSLVGTSVGTGLVQTSVIDKGVDLNAPSCGDRGTGAFNWLLRLDPSGSQITTGGAPPSPDPLSTGYCFYRHQLGQLDIEPAQASYTADDAGALTTAPISLLNVPVFLSPDAGAADPSNVIILPLRNAVLKDFTLSHDNNCIGAFNVPALAPTCIVSDPSSCSKWHTAGSLGAVMTLEDADKVPLTILPETLCVLLTLSSADPTTHGCMRDGQGKIIPKGNFCWATNKPDDCQDSFWLSATFAGAAVTINDGSKDPTCQGPGDGGPGDAGTDAPSDANSADAGDAGDATTE